MRAGRAKPLVVRWLHAGLPVAGAGGRIGVLGQVEEDEDVLEGVADHGGSSHRKVERCRDELAAVTDEELDSVLDVGDEPVRLIALSGGQHQLAVPVGQLESRLAHRVVRPLQPVAQCTAVEAQPVVQIRNRHGHRVHSSEDPAFGHAASLA